MNSAEDGEVNAGITGARVAVAGGSLGGLTAALVLRDAGCDVEVHERSPTPLEGGGAGIVLHPAATRYLTRNDVLDVSDISVRANSLLYMDRDGAAADQQPVSYRFSSYNALYEGLMGCFDEDRYHLGEEVIGFEENDGGVEVEFAGGKYKSCDLLVCADGIHSTARRLLLPDVTPEYAGYVGWRGTVEESELETFDKLRETIIYYVMSGSHILAYPIPGAGDSLEPGRRLINWVWYRNVPAGPQLDDLMTDKEGETHEASLGPGAVRESHIEELRETARSTLAPPLAEMVLKTAEPFIQVILDVEVPRMVFGRMALIGDAAFALRPHAAVGTAKAAEDAWKLGEAVRETDDLPAALERWEPGQLELGKRALARTRDAGRRSQFKGTWQIGDPLPFGLYEVGDSEMP